MCCGQVHLLHINVILGIFLATFFLAAPTFTDDIFIVTEETFFISGVFSGLAAEPLPASVESNRDELMK